MILKRGLNSCADELFKAEVKNQKQKLTIGAPSILRRRSHVHVHDMIFTRTADSLFYTASWNISRTRQSHQDANTANFSLKHRCSPQHCVPVRCRRWGWFQAADRKCSRANKTSCSRHRIEKSSESEFWKSWSWSTSWRWKHLSNFVSFESDKSLLTATAGQEVCSKTSVIGKLSLSSSV